MQPWQRMIRSAPRMAQSRRISGYLPSSQMIWLTFRPSGPSDTSHLVHRRGALAQRLGKRRHSTVPAQTDNPSPDAMMTSQQLADELKRIATTQVSDITRAVKEGQKSIALNEVRDMARRLGLLADAFDPKSAAEKAEPVDDAQAA
jgi:hypothetical protein